MGSDRPAVEWYRDRIRQKQRKATMLTIDIELNAQDKEDAGSLVQTIERLDSADRDPRTGERYRAGSQ